MFRTTSRMIKFCKDKVDINIIESTINKIKSHNLKLIDHIEITMYNPDTVSKFSVFRKAIFHAEIHMKNNNIQVRKEFYNNDPEKLTREINDFLDKEIKV